MIPPKPVPNPKNSRMTTDKATLLQTIGEATKDLLFPSESDFPIEPFDFGDAEPTAEGLRKALGKDETAAVEDTTLAEVFEGLTSAADDASESEKESARRFANVVQVLEANLKDVRGYRIGKTEIDVVVLGRHESGAWLGVKTKVVET